MTGEDDILEKLQLEKELVGMYLSSHPLDAYSFELENFTTCQIGELPALIAECQEKNTKMKVNVAGFVTAKSEGYTKTNRPMSKMTVEDYGGSYEFAFFGKDHETFMQYEKLHSALFIEGVIEEKYFIKPEDRAKGKTSDYAFKPRNMMLLGNVTDTYVKGFSIQLSTPMLSQEFREKLVKMIKKNKGNVPLTMFLYDPENKWNIEFLSRKFKVAVTAELLEELRTMNITWKLLKK
jgi:DNA polymerase-3 subunit alpha